MNTFAVCYNPKISNSIKVKDKLIQILLNKGVLVESIDIDNLKDGFDFVFVIGGDGTILKAARFYAKCDIPIFGVNLGRLGFLSQSSKDDLETSVNDVLKGNFVIDNRIMLQSENYYALNDFVIKGCDTGRTSKFILKLNDKFVCDYLADGIIISTPTGSTAYGLSAGGPVLTPTLNAFVIVPICPHTLNARPLVVPDTEIITVCSDKTSIISADGQETYEFGNEIVIKKSNYNAKLALMKNCEFYSILRNKLHWSTHPKYSNL